MIGKRDRRIMRIINDLRSLGYTVEVDPAHKYARKGTALVNTEDGLDWLPVPMPEYEVRLQVGGYALLYIVSEETLADKTHREEYVVYEIVRWFNNKLKSVQLTRIE